MKPVRLKTEEMRRWRQNSQILVDKDGKPVRPAKPAEVMLLARVLLEAKKRAVGVRASLPDGVIVEAFPHQKTSSNPFAEPNHEIEFEELIDGKNPRSDRELMSAEMFALHGECFLRAVNGTRLKAIRDPSLRTIAGAQRNVPDPEKCICTKFAQREPGKHHLLCQYNSKAPPEQRGTRLMSAHETELMQTVSAAELQFTEPKERVLPPKPVREAVPEIRTIPLEVGTKSEGAIEVEGEEVLEPSKLPSPSDCVCKDFPGDFDPEHHKPICQFFEQWERREKPQQFLVEPETGTNIRPASLEEIEQADQAETKTGARLISLGSPEDPQGMKAYAVLPLGRP